MTEFNLKNQRLLVIAPHSDDEILGCGGLISKVKNPAKLLSTTPIPNGRKDMKPNIIDDVYMDNILRKFKLVISKDVRT